MPKLSVTTTTTTEVKLTPALRKKLQQGLREYAALKSQLDALKHAVEKKNAELGKLRDDTGEISLALEGFGRITLVGGFTKRLDKKKLIAQGVTQEQLDYATTEKPKKSFNKITLPGEKDDEGDDE